MGWRFTGGEPATPIVPSTGKPKIAILCPHTTEFTAEFVESTWTPLKHVMPWCDKVFLQSRAPSLPLARNMLVERVVTDASITHVLWIDSDMTPHSPPDINQALHALYTQCEHGDIVSGLYRAKQQHGFNWAMWMHMEGAVCGKCNHGSKEWVVGTKCPDCGGVLNQKSGFVPIDSWSGNWFEVDVVGMGFCMMKIEVVKAVLDKIKYDNDKLTDILKNYKSTIDVNRFMVKTPFHWDSEGEQSEDFHFLMLAKSLGYKVKVFSEVLLNHIGTLVVEPTIVTVTDQSGNVYKSPTFRTLRV